MEPFAWAIPYVTAMSYATPRLLVAFSIVPLLSKEALPTLMRILVVLALAVTVVPGLVEGAGQTRGIGASFAILAKEGVIGLVLGFILAVPLWAFDAMGDLADTQRGTNMSQTLNPLTGHESSPLGDLFSQAIVTALFATGGFGLMLGAIYETYTVWPVYDTLPRFDPQAGKAMLALLDRLMLLAVLLSAPVVFVMFIAESGLAIVSRFTPQLQVFFLALPVKSGLAMLTFAVYTAVLFDYGQTLLGGTAWVWGGR